MLVISKQDETIKLLKTQLKEIDKEQRAPLLWLQAEIEEGFGEAKKAAKYFKNLSKTHRDDARGSEALYCMYRVLVNAGLASKSDLKSMGKFVKDEDNPITYRDKIQKLLDRLEPK